MSKYQIIESDHDLALEFKKNLFENNFYHSPSLQRILNLFRSNADENKYVLFKPSNKKIWYLANLPRKRGKKIKINYKISFDNILDAEWYVFKKRWKKHTGKNLKI
tara:strand:+ start:157 stop:474 length:318 start_codon:yes stop_codon:yes gene_type:complete